MEFWYTIASAQGMGWNAFDGETCANLQNMHLYGKHQNIASKFMTVALCDCVWTTQIDLCALTNGINQLPYFSIDNARYLYKKGLNS